MNGVIVLKKRDRKLFITMFLYRLRFIQNPTSSQIASFNVSHATTLQRAAVFICFTVAPIDPGVEGVKNSIVSNWCLVICWK